MKQKIFMTVALLFLAIAFLMGQVVDTTGITDPVFPGGEGSLQDLLTYYDAIFGALVIVWGYLAKFFGIKVKPGRYVFVVVAGAIVIGGGFLALGVSQFLPLLFSFLSAIGIYDIFLKPSGAVVKANKR